MNVEREDVKGRKIHGDFCALNYFILLSKFLHATCQTLRLITWNESSSSINLPLMQIISLLYRKRHWAETVEEKALHAKLQSLKLRRYNSSAVTDDDVFLGIIVQLKCVIIEEGDTRLNRVENCEGGKKLKLTIFMCQWITIPKSQDLCVFR